MTGTDFGEEFIQFLSERASQALEKARSIGHLIGYVSRRYPSKVVEGINRVAVELRPEVYYSDDLLVRVGDYLIGVDIRSLKAVGLKIVSIVRSDAVSEVEPSLSLHLEPSVESLLTTVIVEVTPLLSETGEPFNSPLEPQSPVVKPLDGGLIARTVGLPTEGVTLGYLHTGSAPVSHKQVKMLLPKYEFFKHILVIGTTGSGKTTFLKNLMYAFHVEWRDLMTLIVDAAGDYPHAVLPQPSTPQDFEPFADSVSELREKAPNWISVLVPVRRGETNAIEFAEKYVKERFGRVLKVFHGIDLSNVEIELSDRDFGTSTSLLWRLELGGRESTVEVIPISLSYYQIKDHLEIFPLFSRQAKVYLRNVVGYLESEEGPIRNFTHLFAAFHNRFKELRENLKLHKSTLESIERALNFIASSEEVDAGFSQGILGMPPAEKLAENYRGPIILDLDYAALRGAHFLVLNMIAYEFMRNLFIWKKTGTGIQKPAVLILDEAHRFFPSEGTTSEEVELLADFIARVCRLGRSRGLGLIFSTHSPKDVHKIVIQLTNTKVIFRSEREYLEMLDVPRELIPLIELMEDRVALLKTPTIRSGHVFFRTSEPLLGHFDLGRASV